MDDKNTFREELKVTGQQFVDTAKQAVHAGNVRRLVIRNSEGQTFIALTLTVSLVLAVLFPWLVVVGIIALIATNASVNIERDPDTSA
jgi:Domain of unknown function (DUF4342)